MMLVIMSVNQSLNPYHLARVRAVTQRGQARFAHRLGMNRGSCTHGLPAEVQ